MKEKILKTFKAEIKSVDEDKHTLEAVISTKKVDRMGDVVLPSSIEGRIKTYKQHPILLSSHNYWALTAQIGKAEDIKIEEDKITARFKYFVGEGNPEADWAWVLASKGIAAFSIGFMAHEFEYITEKDDEGNERTTGRKFTDVELLEVSQVLVPANRSALQMSMESADEERGLCEAVMKSFEKGELKERPYAPVETKPVDVTDDYIRVRIRNPDLFKDDSFRTIWMSKDDGIKAIVGKFKDESDDSTHVQAVLFDKEKWTVDKAKQWVEDHKDDLKSINETHYSEALLGKGTTESDTEPTQEDIIGAVKSTIAEKLGT